MTFPPDDEYGELLRRALRAEADAVVPSPEGLEIIRGRIARRGLRNMFWWRAGASLAGAVLVAGTVVMIVPDLRTQVVESTGISQSAGRDDGERDTSSITRPPYSPPPPVVVIPSVGGSRPHVSTPTPSPHRTSLSPRPTPSKSDSCASSPAGPPADSPGVVEPEPTALPSCPPAQTAQPPPPPHHPPVPTVTAMPSAPPTTAPRHTPRPRTTTPPHTTTPTPTVIPTPGETPSPQA